MKNRISQARLFAVVGVLSIFQAGSGVAAINTSDAGLSAVPVNDSAQVNVQTKVPYGVEDVVRLSKAQVSEDVIITFIHNTGTIYNLAPQDIVYLRDQGVSDRVINVMLDQRTAVAQTSTAQVAAQNAQAAQQAASAPTYTQQPATTYTEAPSSSLQVIPYPPATAAYYGYPYYYGGYGPYYGGYYGYPGFGLTFAFGSPYYYNHAHAYYSHGYYGGRYGGHYGGYHGGSGHWSGGGHGGHR